MVSLQAVECPYCHGTSYFASGLEDGHCTGCGRIIYAASDTTVEFTGDAPKAEMHELTIRYVKRSYNHSRTMMVAVKGPVTKEFAVNIDESMKVALPEGEYQVIGTVHFDGGVNSTDTVGSKVIDLRGDVTVEVETTGIFSRRMTFR